jgi:hypothetical protein
VRGDVEASLELLDLKVHDRIAGSYRSTRGLVGVRGGEIADLAMSWGFATTRGPRHTSPHAKHRAANGTSVASETVCKQEGLMGSLDDDLRGLLARGYLRAMTQCTRAEFQHQ